MLLSCGAGEASWKSLGLQGGPTSPFWRDQPWDFFGRNGAKAETPVLWPPHAKSWLIGKDSDAGRDWGQEEKGTTEDEMVGWHHWLDGHESEWTPGVGDGQGGMACCDSWRRKESDRTERLNWTESMCGRWREEGILFLWWTLDQNLAFAKFSSLIDFSLFLWCLSFVLVNRDVKFSLLKTIGKSFAFTGVCILPLLQKHGQRKEWKRWCSHRR